MSVIIVQNKNIPNENKSNKSTRQKFDESRCHLSMAKAKEQLNMEEFVLPKEEFILVGDTTGNGNYKTKYFPEASEERIGIVYSEKDKKVLSLPKSISSVGFYIGEIRIYSTPGIIKKIHADEITVLKSNNKEYFRIGKTHKEIKQDMKRESLAKNGIYRKY